jgi:predicted enzyme related to lactoylglutathione lyase
VLGRVEEAGGTIIEPKTHIPSVGWVAQVLDSEGNRVGLHSAL